MSNDDLYQLTDEQKMAIRKAFDEYDKDGSGFIDKGELSVLARELGEELEPDELEEGMKTLDTSGDGKVSFEEFIEWWQQDD